tara:strand:+ start:712 stop:915 length:204 start_codon:yes stop_codon:yes gene_type:complete
MTKKRNRKYLKYLTNKAIKYYFANPEDNNMKDLAEKFNLPQQRLSKALSVELKKRVDNSMPRRCLRV